MAEAYRETTVWEGATTINHTYLLEGDNMIAYMRSQTSVPFYFKKPIRIDKRGRKFERLDVNPFELVPQVVVAQESTVKEIEGSKGAKYYVDLEA
jgi:hypothetical protein